MEERFSEDAVREVGRFFLPDFGRKNFSFSDRIMNKTVSIRENKDFKRLYYRGKSVADDCLVVYYRRNGSSLCRLGLTVSAKVGKAVVRNRIRRLIRESYRLMEDRVLSGFDIVVVARGRAANADYKTINSSLEKAFKKCGLIK